MSQNKLKKQQENKTTTKQNKKTTKNIIVQIEMLKLGAGQGLACSFRLSQERTSKPSQPAKHSKVLKPTCGRPQRSRGALVGAVYFRGRFFAFCLKKTQQPNPTI